MSDPILDIKRFAERAILQILPQIPTSFEGVSFDPPSTIYQRTQFIINPPSDPVFPAGFHRENVQFQVFVNGPLNEGTADVIAQATKIREAFKKGLSFIEGNTHIHVLRTPQITGTAIVNDRIICPVLIPLTGEVYSD